MKRIFLSFPLSQDFDHYQTITDLLPFIDGLHLDLMDGIFVPAQQGSVQQIQLIRETSSLPLWIHAMVMHPRTPIEQLQLSQGDIISIHYEHCDDSSRIAREYHLQHLAQLIAQKGAIPSCALSPGTPLDSVEPLLTSFHHILLMTVEPGASGQTMLPQSIQRYQELKNITCSSPTPTTIGLDGGITAKMLLHFSLAPTDAIDIAVHSAILKAPDPGQALEELRKALA